MLNIQDICKAAERIKQYVVKTPLLNSCELDNYLGHTIYFKMESLQKVGAFKARGALNVLMWLEEQGELPQEVVAYSSGNHAQGVAWASGIFGIKARIYMPSNVSEIKKQKTIEKVWEKDYLTEPRRTPKFGIRK